MSDWIALGRDNAGALGILVRGAVVQMQASSVDEAAVLTQLGAPDATIVRIGDGASTPLPAPILPGSGPTLPALTQTNPADAISAWVRLWIAGYLNANPNWDGVICALQGDVTHWVHISADEAVSCQSFLTPRLCHALGGSTSADTQAIADSLSRPERLAAQLRVAEISGSPAALTGHLIGAELAAARPYWLGQQVAVIGNGDLAKTYAEVLEGQGVPVNCVEVGEVLPSGLAALGRAMGFDNA